MSNAARAVLVAATLGAWGAAAQMSAADHASHHPGGEAPADAEPARAGDGVAAPSGAPAPAVGCGAMGCMGRGATPFYAALMAMPSLTPQARQFIEAEADRRLALGAEAVTTGQAPLHAALSANDPAAMQQAIAGIRSGVMQAESGAAALQAAGEDTPPRQIALTWFGAQMSTPVTLGMTMGDGPFGLTWFHVAAMASLVAFMLAALLIQAARSHRIGVLVQRLTPGASPASGPPASGPSAPSTPAAPGPARPRPWSGTLRVAAIFRETATVKTFRLAAPVDEAMPFTFLPGQFLTFAAEIDGRTIRRSYTIASSPAQRDYVEITVKREEQGAESRYLHDHVAVGDALAVSGPSGAFTFTGAEAASVVLIGGGVGITPMMCAIRYLTDRAYPGDIFLLYGARTAGDLIFREELDYLHKRHGNLHVTLTLSEPGDAAWQGATGPISKVLIVQAVPDIARRRVHLCGPPGMMAAVRATLADLGVPVDKIKSEAFGPAQGAVAPPPSAAPPSPAAVSAQAEIKFSRSGKSGPLAPDQSVLEAAEAAGVAIDFSCRVGTCGTCVVPLSSGTVTMAVEDGLSPTDKARGIILACQAKSAGNLVVDA